jgi:uncharacterized protein DUF6984
MIESVYRPLTPEEHAIFRRLLDRQFAGRDQLMQQLEGLLVRQIDAEGSLELNVSAPVRAEVKERVPTEAFYKDADPESEGGPRVHVLLHVVDGRMVELEIYKDDGSTIEMAPSADRLEFFPDWPAGWI